mmetsp:Transcript_37065/g.66741  ORF Transcript_37065/g.66741 Transcript_37065/m.66741 type:complete len:85 (-) Transcript_37065:294-548(-)
MTLHAIALIDVSLLEIAKSGKTCLKWQRMKFNNFAQIVSFLRTRSRAMFLKSLLRMQERTHGSLHPDFDGECSFRMQDFKPSEY